MTPLCVAASIAAQVVHVLAARHTTRTRRDRDAHQVAVNGFRIRPGSYLHRASQGHHGPEAQRAALAELDVMGWFEKQMGAAS